MFNKLEEALKQISITGYKAKKKKANKFIIQTLYETTFKKKNQCPCQNPVSVS